MSRHLLFRRAAVAGRQRVFSWVASSRVVKSHWGGPDVVCHCGCTGDRGLFAPQSSCHTCRTPPWACSVGSQSGATPKGVRTCWTHCVHLGVGSRHPRPYEVDGVRMDTLGHSDAPAACIVMEGSGRVGPSVVVNASKAGVRRTHHLNTRSARPLVPERTSKLVLDLSMSKCSLVVLCKCTTT